MKITLIDSGRLLKKSLKDAKAAALNAVVDNLVYYVDQTLAVEGEFSVQGFIRSLQKEEGL